MHDGDGGGGMHPPAPPPPLPSSSHPLNPPFSHSTGTTHWMDPRLAHMMKHTLLDCEDNGKPGHPPLGGGWREKCVCVCM